MANQMIILLVIGSLLGLFGGSAISKLNPFKAGKVAVAKQESVKEEYFKDKVKNIEYRMTERSKGSIPVKQTFGQSIGSFVDKSIKAIISFVLISIVASLVFGINLFKYVARLRKTVKQMVQGIEKAKPKLNGTENILKIELSQKMDEESKSVVDQIKRK